MDVPLNEFELGEIERLITMGIHQTEASEMRSDMMRMILEGVERIMFNARERRTRNNFEYAPPAKPHHPFGIQEK